MDRVYCGNSTTWIHLKEANESKVQSIDPGLTVAVMKNIRERAQPCIDA